jgi:protein O-GlcNAc transferase
MNNKPGNPYNPSRSILKNSAVGFSAAVQHLQAGRLGEAQSNFRQILAGDPQHYQSLHYLGMIEHRLGNTERSLDFFRRCFTIRPDYVEGYSDLAQILSELGRDADAVSACKRAIAVNPHHAPSYRNLGNLYLKKGDLVEARNAFGRALEADPDYGPAYASLADVLTAEGRLQEALLACDRALSLSPNHAFAHGVKGTILQRRGKFAEAVNAYSRALRINPNMGMLYGRFADALRSIGRFEDAIEAGKRAIQVDPKSAETHLGLGLAFQATGHNDDAITTYRKAIVLKPNLLEAYTNLGLLLQRTGRCEEATDAYKAAIAIDPQCEFALTNLASILKEQGCLSEAADTYRRLSTAGASHISSSTLYDTCYLRRQICDWDGLEDAEASAIRAVHQSGERVPPFPALFMHSSPADQLAFARSWARGFAAGARNVGGAARATNPEGNLRVGYLFSDFHSHSLSGLVADIVEHHDRKRFGVMGYCWSHDDGSDAYQRLTGAFDNYVDLRTFSNADAARQIHNDGIDVLVDLKGYTPDARPLILASRPAPIQVNFLGFPGTMGAPFIDYIIADSFVVPMTHQAFYDEKIVHMPDCYQPTDTKRKTATTLDRMSCGLPEGGFVFSSFSQPVKIMQDVFAIWLRLLQGTPDSVLWLLDTEPAVKMNLEAAATAAGIAKTRLIFAPDVVVEDQLARYRLANLFLDTLPHNAHSVTGEALWSGLPVVTCVGDTFASRVSGSLLKAARMPELITYSLEEYETLALKLANDQGMLDNLRGRLESNRISAPLFAIEAYTRSLEAAYAHMVALRAHGHSPETFSVADIQESGRTRISARG